MSLGSRLPTLFGRATLVSDGHNTLNDSVRALRELCALPESVRTTREAELRTSFEGFAARVLAHFALEEGGGYFGTLAKESPELVDQIAHLKGEHRAMKTDLSNLSGSSGAFPGSSAFVTAVGRLLDQFEAHEQREARVLERFFLAETKDAG